jgi:hypothetical protein
MKVTGESASSNALAAKEFPGMFEDMPKKVFIQPSRCST